MTNDTALRDLKRYQGYLASVIELIMEKASETKQMKLAAEMLPGRPFLDGELYGYYRVLTFMKQETIGYMIPLEEIGLADINLEEFC